MLFLDIGPIASAYGDQPLRYLYSRLTAFDADADLTHLTIGEADAVSDHESDSTTTRR